MEVVSRTSHHEIHHKKDTIVGSQHIFDIHYTSVIQHFHNCNLIFEGL